MTTEPAHARIVPTDHPCFDDFVATIAALRAPDGCPWDRAQTHQSIAHNMIEEAYEAVDAIESGDTAHLREELGDVLLQVVLQSQIAADAGAFDIDDVCADVNAKMIRRHPHVFGEARADNASEVLDLWDQVKLAERSSQSAADPTVPGATAPRTETGNASAPAAATGTGASGSGATAGAAASVAGAADQAARREGLLDGVPTSFPALMQAQKVSRKAASAGFEWDTLDDVWGKVREEVDELRAAYAAAPKAANGKVDAGAAEGDSAAAEQAAASVEDEFGDVLFSLVQVGRHMGVDAENALRASCGKFRRRWSFMEGAAWARGTTVDALAPDEREALWQQAKARERA